MLFQFFFIPLPRNKKESPMENKKKKMSWKNQALIKRYGEDGVEIYKRVLKYMKVNGGVLSCDKYETISFWAFTNSDVIRDLVENTGLFFVIDGYFSNNIEAISQFKKDNIAEKKELVEDKPKKKPKEVKKLFDFEKALIEYGFEEMFVKEWINIRKKKKATNSEVAFNLFIREVEKSNRDKQEILEIVVKKQWSGFEATWLDNLNNQNSTNFNNGNKFFGTTAEPPIRTGDPVKDLLENAKRAGRKVSGMEYVEAKRERRRLMQNGSLETEDATFEVL